MAKRVAKEIGEGVLRVLGKTDREKTSGISRFGSPLDEMDRVLLSFSSDIVPSFTGVLSLRLVQIDFDGFKESFYAREKVI